MNGDERLLIITGPTASGKTGLAIKLAQHFKCPVISADSRQFYREMPIGTAQPTFAERQNVPHYFIGNLGINDNMSAGRYADEVRNLLQELFQEHNTVIICGGTGLYIQALLYGMDEFPEVPDELRTTLNERLKKEGLDSLVSELRRLDPDFCSSADLQNPQRVLRALEVCFASGRPFSSFKNKQNTSQLPWKTHLFCLNPEREILYQNIDHRVDEMIKNGLEDEARALLPYRHLNALNTVGYKELFAYFDGVTDRDTAIHLIKQHTRNYAKRQMTWFRKMKDIQFPDADAFTWILERIGN